MESDREKGITALFILIIIVISSYYLIEIQKSTSIKFTGVMDTFYSNDNVKILESKWSIILKDSKIHFTAIFTELNIDENNSKEFEDRYDYYKLEMEDYYEIVDFEDGIYYSSGTMIVEKNGKHSDEWEGTEIYIHPDDWNNQLCIYYEELWMFGSILPQ